MQISTSATFNQVALGPHFACADAGQTNGTPGPVYCWGANESGQLGNGTTTNSSVPVQISTSATFNTVSLTPVNQ